MKLKAISRILVIDDDIAVFRGIKSIVEDEFSSEVKVEYALTVNDGYARFFAEPPDLCFLDIRFQNDDEAGIKLLKRIRSVQVSERVPIILLSVPHLIDRFLADLDERHYPDDFMSKPLPAVEVAAKIKQWDRTLHAERLLANQKERLRLQAEKIARKNIEAMKHLGEQYEIASLGLFTKGLLEIIDDSLSAIRGYAVLVDKQMLKGEIADKLKDKLVKVVLENTETPKRITHALRNYMTSGQAEPKRADIIPILDAIVGLAEYELRKKDLEVEKNLHPVGKCFTVPAYFVRAVVSLLLFYMDSALKGELLTISTGETGEVVEVKFGARISDRIAREAEKVDLHHRPDGTLVAHSSSPQVYSVARAVDAARLMGGGVEFRREKDEFHIVLLLSKAPEPISLGETEDMKGGGGS